jgi:hypothetical protein
MSSGSSIPAKFRFYKVDGVSATRVIAIIYVLAVTTIFFGLVLGYSGLFKAKQFENPGLSAYRPPPGTITANPLVWLELVPIFEEDVGNGIETVGERAAGRRADSAMASSDGRGRQGRHAKAAYLGRQRPWPHGLVMTLAPGRFSHLRNQVLRPSQRVRR